MYCCIIIIIIIYLGANGAAVPGSRILVAPRDKFKGRNMSAKSKAVSKLIKIDDFSGIWSLTALLMLHWPVVAEFDEICNFKLETIQFQWTNKKITREMKKKLEEVYFTVENNRANDVDTVWQLSLDSL